MVVFIADFFKDEVTGGAEKNDWNLIEMFSKKELLFSRKNSHNVSLDFLRENKNKFFIVANFVNLSIDAKAYLAKNCKYIIYEHDYKFDGARNPIDCRDFKIPIWRLTNQNFYANAFKVVCLSKMHYNIYKTNLPNLDNLTYINCSLFSQEHLELMKSLYQEVKKKDCIGIINSSNPVKRTKEQVDYCEKMNWDYELFSDNNYESFLEKMAGYKRLFILPGHPEPTPRTAVEARLMGLEVIGAKNLIGVAHENWWTIKDPLRLSEEISQIREGAFDFFNSWYVSN